MKRFPMLVLAALLGAAVSAPAQVVIEARLGRDLRGAVVIGNQRDYRDRDRDHRDHRRFDRSRDHCEPIRRAPLPRGRWETVEEQYLVPGYWDEHHVPPTYGWIYDHCGRRHWGIIDHGGCRRVWVPARWETRCRQVWVTC
jgi:hypothetical protein